MQLSLVSSHERKACGYVHTHTELFRDMYSIVGTGDLLVRMLRSWGKMKVNEHRPTRMFEIVGTSSTLSCKLTRRERMRICSHAYRTVRGMYSILGTGDLLVCMLRSWGKMKVNQHMSTRMFATVGTSATLSCKLTRTESMRICSHAYRTVQRYV